MKIVAPIHDVRSPTRISRSGHQHALPRTQCVRHVEEIVVVFIQEDDMRIVRVIQSNRNRGAVVVCIQNRLDPTTTEIGHVRHIGVVGLVSNVEFVVSINSQRCPLTGHRLSIKYRSCPRSALFVSISHLTVCRIEINNVRLVIAVDCYGGILADIVG